jgi:hypothetical protein
MLRNKLMVLRNVMVETLSKARWKIVNRVLAAESGEKNSNVGR